MDKQNYSVIELILIISNKSFTHLYTLFNTLGAKFIFRRRKRKMLVIYRSAIYENLLYCLKGLLRFLGYQLSDRICFNKSVNIIARELPIFVL